MEVTDLIVAYLRAKEAETTASAERVRIGEVLASQLAHPDEGSQTHTIGDYKVTISGVINRKVDWDSLHALRLEHCPERIKYELDMAGVRYYEGRPEYNDICKTITAAPGRTQIAIKEAKEKK